VPTVENVVLEVQAIERSGNQTISEITFRVS
jgi:hypothetical protein